MVSGCRSIERSDKHDIKISDTTDTDLIPKTRPGLSLERIEVSVLPDPVDRDLWPLPGTAERSPVRRSRLRQIDLRRHRAGRHRTDPDRAQVSSIGLKRGRGYRPKGDRAG